MIIKYAFPTIALIISWLSYKNSKKINNLEEKLKKYELEKIEEKRKEANRSCVEARVINISKGKYRIKFWNSGKAIAYNVNFEVEESYKGMVFKDKVPYEILETGKNFEEIVVVAMGMPSKFEIITTWEDKQGKKHSKTQIVSI